MTDQLTLRLTIADPVQGLHYSLQDPRNVPVDTGCPAAVRCHSMCR